ESFDGVTGDLHRQNEPTAIRPLSRVLNFWTPRCEAFSGLTTPRVRSDGAPGFASGRLQLTQAKVFSPAIGKDGMVYVPCRDGNFFVIASDGSYRSLFKSDDGFDHISPAIGKDETIYVLDRVGRLYAIAPGGESYEVVHKFEAWSDLQLTPPELAI